MRPLERFAGAFDVACPLAAPRQACLLPHPETGSCECPGDFSRSSLRVISHAIPTNMAGDLGFCVQAP